MDLKEIEAKIRADCPEFAEIIDKWPSQEDRDFTWRVALFAYNLGFTSGVTYGFEQHAKVMEFSFGKIFGK